MGKRLYKKPEPAHIQGICCVPGCNNLQQVVRKGKYGTTCSPCDRKRYNTAEKEKFAGLKKLYGLTETDYNALLESQDHKCYLCGKHENEVPKKVLHVDHCHSTNKIRGLLCHNCNTGLGHFQDNIELLQKAIEYLKKNQ